jgi:hypothetical protein
LFWLRLQAHRLVAGMVRRMSISLRAPTVVVKLPAVAIEFGGGADLDLEVAGGELQVAGGPCAPARLARIGKVCRFSTMPATD